MLHLVGKTAPTHTQLKNCVRDKFKSVEIQLFADFLDTNCEVLTQLLMQFPTLDVSSVHTPLLPYKELEIEDLADSNLKFPVLKTMYLADVLASRYGHRMPVVVHATSNIDALMETKDTLYRIVRELEVSLKLFPNIDICIENTIPLIVKGKRYETKNSFLYDNINLVKFFRERLESERIYTVLDICHALSSIRFMQTTEELTGHEVPQLENFFKESEGLIRIIHMNNVIEMGLKPGQHGVPFLKTIESDVEMLKHVTNCIENYCPKASIVLEIVEDEYEVNSNANKLKTLECFDFIGAKYKIV